MKRTVNRLVSALAIIALALPLIVSVSPATPALAAETPELKRALLATVEILVPIDGEEDQAAGGSGSVLSADGYILTNFHVVADIDGTGELYNRDGMAAIAVNSATDLHSMPTYTYKAKVVKGDPELDLAVLKIVGYLNDDAELPANLGLVTMPIGDSSKVEFDDVVRCLGFPGIGGDSVTFTKGTIAGFLDKAKDGSPLWFKSDAQVNHGNSGGAAINEKGEIIGVPTRISTDAAAAGKISLIRPINLATPIIKAAMTDVSSDPLPPDDNGGARITNLVFTDVVDKQGRPGKARAQFDPGVKQLYAVFNFSGFEDGQDFDFAWQRDGKDLVSDSTEWSEGAEGRSWVNLANDKGLTQGLYELSLSLDGEELQTAKVRIGKAPKAKATPKFGAITFAEGVDDQDEPVNPHEADESFAAGTGEVYAFFDYSNVPEGTPYSYTWYVDDEEVLAREYQWEATDGSGSYWLQVNSEDGLPPGSWRLELAIDGQPAGEGEFVIGDGEQQVTDEGVQIIGTVIDADTKRAIADALVLVLVPGTDPEEFLDDPQDAQVFASGRSDRKGAFSLNALLERGQIYTVIVAAKNYQPVVEEDFGLGPYDESPYEVTVRLQKR